MVTPFGPGAVEMSRPPTPLATTFATFCGLTMPTLTSVMTGALLFENFAVLSLLTIQGDGIGNVPLFAESL